MANPVYSIPYEVWRLTPEDEAIVAQKKKTRRSRKGLDVEEVHTRLARSAAARVYAAGPEVFAWPIPDYILKSAAQKAWPYGGEPSGQYERWFTSTLKRLSGEAAFERRREAGELGPDLEYELARFGLRAEPTREPNPVPRDTSVVSRLRF